MKEIKSANDIIVVPVSYFNGMEKEKPKILKDGLRMKSFRQSVRMAVT